MSTDNLNSPWPLATEIVCTAIVPDDIGACKNIFKKGEKMIFINLIIIFYK
jgi:hypothetical protein